MKISMDEYEFGEKFVSAFEKMPKLDTFKTEQDKFYKFANLLIQQIGIKIEKD